MAFQPVIYTFGGSEYINSIMESMSMLFDFSKRSELITLYRFAGVLGVLLLALRPFAARGADGSPGALDWPWFIRFALIILVLIVPKTDVRIEDITLKKTYVVTSAPWALSIFGWLTSSIGYGLTDMYENVLGGGMNPVESYSGNGIAFGSQYYNILPKISHFEAKSMDNFVRPFINECMVPAVTPINAKISGLTKDEFLNAPSYAAALANMNPLWLKNRYVDTPNGAVTCLDMRQMITTQWEPDSVMLLNRIGVSENTVGELDNSYIKQATDASASSLKQGMMINAIYSSVAGQGVQYGDSALADSLYQAQAQYQQVTAWRQGSQFASVSLVWLHIVVEGMIYAIWPLLTFLMLFPSGWMVIVQYVKILFWIQMWPILYAILNSIIAVYATSKSSALAMQYGGFTMSNFFQIGDLNGGIVATAGYISTMVPIISWMLIQQGGGILDAVRSHVAANNSAAQQAGTQETAGSMTLNKVTVQDSNTAGNSVTGMGTNKEISSAGTSTSVGDVTTLQSSAMDNKLTTGINYNKTMQNQLSNMRSELDSQVGSAKDAFSNARQSMYDAQKGTQGSQGHNVSDGGSQSDALSNGLSIISKMSASLGKFGVSGGINAQALNDLKNSLTQLKNVANSDSYGDNSSVGNAFKATEGAIKQSEKVISMAESYQKAESIVNSSGYAIQSNGDNEFVKDLRSQGYTDSQILGMQQNDVGKFNNLANDFADRYVKNILGDNSNYSTEGLNHDNAQDRIQQLYNQYGNDGGTDKVSGGANHLIKNEQGYIANQQQEMNDRYSNQNEQQEHPGHIIVNQGKQVGGVATGVFNDASEGTKKLVPEAVAQKGENQANAIVSGNQTTSALNYQQGNTGKGGANSYTKGRVNVQ